MLHKAETPTTTETFAVSPSSLKKCIYFLAKNNECKTLATLLDVNFISDFGINLANKTPLHIAAEKGSLEATLLLLQHPYTHKLNLNLEDKQGLTALDLAYKFGHTAIAELLVIYGATKGSHRPDINWLPASLKGKTSKELLSSVKEEHLYSESMNALLFLMAENDEDKTLFDLIAGVDHLKRQFTGGKTILHAAVEKKSLKALFVLLSPANSQKIDLNIADNMGNTPYQRASVLNYKEIMKALLPAQADLRENTEKPILTQEKKLMSSFSTSQTLFSSYPECVQLLAKFTDINPKELKSYYDANDGRYLRLENLKWYLRDYSNPKRDPASTFSIKEVLELNDQECSNLETCPHLIQRKIFLIDEVKSFNEAERKFLDKYNGYFDSSAKASIREAFEAFQNDQKKYQMALVVHYK